MPDSEAVPRNVSPQQIRSLTQPWRFCCGLFLAALLVNVTAAFLLRSHTTIATVDADESEYWNIATELQAHGLSGIPARRTLPFPLLLATLRDLVGDNYFYVQLLVSGLLAATPVLAYWLVRRYAGNERAAMLAGVAFLLWPPFVRYGASVYSDSIALMLFLVYLLAFPSFRAGGTPGAVGGPGAAGAPGAGGTPEAAQPRRWAQFALAGALLGLCLQVKPLYLLYTPLAFCLAILSETTIRRGLAAAMVFTLGCILVLAPWSAYISAREGHFILVSANDGETLAGGLNPTLMKMDDSGVFVTAGGRSTWIGPGKWLPMDQTGYLTPKELELPYSQASALMAVRAREWIKTHPAEVAYLSARKLSYMWGIYPFWNGASQSLFGNIPLLLLAVLAGVGSWLNRHAWRRLALFWSLPVLSSGVALVSWGSWRFRMPADAGLLILAAITWAAYFGATRSRAFGWRADPAARVPLELP